MSPRLRSTRILALGSPPSHPLIDLLRLINRKSFEECVKDEIRCSILSLMARGITEAAEIAKGVNISRTAVYRHLKALQKCGLVLHLEGRYYIASRLFIVYDVDAEEGGPIRLSIVPDMGGFVDENVGLVLVKGHHCRCDMCVAKEMCLAAIKWLARKLNMPVRSEDPRQAFRELFAELAKQEVPRLIKEGFMVVKVHPRKTG